MNTIAKKIMVYTLVGVMQLGVGVTLAEAASIRIDSPQRIVQLNDRGRHQRQGEHDRRHRIEQARHVREMQRRRHESEHRWYARQQRENHRHNRELHDLNLFLIGVAIGTLID